MASLKYKDKREEGFTIIEVLIVLAIAGLIILIVFLAVPALQRNSRNTQRHNDVTRFSAAFRECMTNNNNKISLCDEESDLAPYIELDQLLQIEGFAVSPELNRISVDYGKCNSDGTVDPGPASHVYLYLVETSSTGTAQRCIEAL